MKEFGLGPRSKGCSRYHVNNSEPLWNVDTVLCSQEAAATASALLPMESTGVARVSCRDPPVCPDAQSGKRSRPHLLRTVGVVPC